MQLDAMSAKLQEQEERIRMEVATSQQNTQVAEEAAKVAQVAAEEAHVRATSLAKDLKAANIRLHKKFTHTTSPSALRNGLDGLGIESALFTPNEISRSSKIGSNKMLPVVASKRALPARASALGKLKLRTWLLLSYLLLLHLMVMFHSNHQPLDCDHHRLPRY